MVTADDDGGPDVPDDEDADMDDVETVVDDVQQSAIRVGNISQGQRATSDLAIILFFLLLSHSSGSLSPTSYHLHWPRAAHYRPLLYFRWLFRKHKISKHRFPWPGSKKLA